MLDGAKTRLDKYMRICNGDPDVGSPSYISIARGPFKPASFALVPVTQLRGFFLAWGRSAML